MIVFIGFILHTLVLCQDSTDYLNNQGQFIHITNWTMNSTELDQTIIQLDGTNNALKLFKKENTPINFREGIYYNFTKSAPQHLRFWFASGDKEIEDTNLRLKDVENDKTALSFRCGYAGFVRVNDNQMITFYNKTVSNDAEVIWSQADIIMDWTTRSVRIYINQSFMGTSGFYHNEVTGVNQIMLYNLHAGTSSWWKGIKLCKERCENFNWSMLIIINLIIFLN